LRFADTGCQGNATYESTISQLYKITSVLSLFNDINEDKISTQLSCIKLVTKENMLRPDEGSDTGDSVVGKSCSLLAAIVALASVVLNM
jgi:hypothetical protein